MKKKSIKSIFFVILIVCFFTGCTSIKNQIESNSDDVASTISGSDEDVKNDNYSDDSDNLNSHEASKNKKDPSKVTVIFKDSDGNVLKSEEIKKGKDAIPPAGPEKDGYEFIGWNYDYKDVQTDLTVTAVYREIIQPTIVVKNSNASAGDEIDVKVVVFKNPGVLGMVVDIKYDESCLSLTDVSNGVTMNDYMFTPPKNMKSNCSAAWYINDIPEGEQDGEIMTLRFKVLKKAKKGKYDVSVSCLNNAVNNLGESFSFESISGAINVI